MDAVHRDSMHIEASEPTRTELLKDAKAKHHERRSENLASEYLQSAEDARRQILEIGHFNNVST